MTHAKTSCRSSEPLEEAFRHACIQTEVTMGKTTLNHITGNHSRLQVMLTPRTPCQGQLSFPKLGDSSREQSKQDKGAK